MLKNQLAGQKGEFLHNTSRSRRFLLAKTSQPLKHHALIVLGIAAYNIFRISPDLTAQTTMRLRPDRAAKIQPRYVSVKWHLNNLF